VRDDYRKRDDDRVKHRQPDEGILEHERKRKVEVRCMELRIKLEDAEIGEEEIEEQVASLRRRLLEAASHAQGSGYSREETRALRPSDTHALGAAKADETDKMSRALGIRSNYREGDAFDRDLQEKNKLERIEERRKREEDRVRAAEEREKVVRQRGVAFVVPYPEIDEKKHRQALLAAAAAGRPHSHRLHLHLLAEDVAQTLSHHLNLAHRLHVLVEDVDHHHLRLHHHALVLVLPRLADDNVAPLHPSHHLPREKSKKRAVPPEASPQVLPQLDLLVCNSREPLFRPGVIQRFCVLYIVLLHDMMMMTCVFEAICVKSARDGHLYSSSMSPPAVSTAFCNFSASSLVSPSLSTCGEDSTNFFASTRFLR
jgi:hypothetical protein